MLGATFLAGQATVFADDFSAYQSDNWTTSGMIGSSAFAVSRSGADWGARRSSSTAQMELTNDASTSANAIGWVCSTVPTSAFATPYTQVLASNPGLVTWAFNLRQIRTDPAGFGSNTYGVAFILATSNQAANNTGSGYAVVLGQSGSTDPVRLARYSAGLTTGLTNIIVSNTAGVADIGAEYLSVRVTFDPATETWEMFLRNDGTTEFLDPLSGSLVSQGTAIDNTYTGSVLGYLGAYWQGSTSANQTAFVDNISVQVVSDSSPTISVDPSYLSGFMYQPEMGPSAEQVFTVSGQNLESGISITAPVDYEISESSGTGFVSSITLSPAAQEVSPTPIYVRLKAGLVPGIYNEILELASLGAASIYPAVFGSVSSETADPPTIQSYNITGYPAYTSISVEWTPGNGAYRVVKVNTANSFTAPADGTSPSANTFYTGAGEQVVYNGATEFIEGVPYNGCTVTNLSPNTVYWFRVYEYNGTGTGTRYLTSTAVDNPKSVTTTSDPGSGYYAGIYGYGSDLKAMLHSLIKSTHTTQYSYTAVTDQLRYTDEDPANGNNVIELYTGWSVDENDYGSLSTDWNKEHTWSKSHGNFGDVAPAGTDLHHLRPCDATVNSAKSNEDFAEGGTAYTDSSPPAGYTGYTGCFDNDPLSWEPRDTDKGDVARMIMYMAVRYEGDDANFDTDLEIVDHLESDAGDYLPYYGKLSTLLQWHVQDPPDAWELRRNNRIAERQGNRNPFIDIPGYAARVWAPCPLYNTAVTTTGFTGNWSTPISATNYYLQVASDSLFTNIVNGYNNLDVDLLTNLSISGLTAGNTYYYRLRSFFEDDYGMWSPYLAVTLDNPIVATAYISAAVAPEETQLNGAVITFTLLNAEFADQSLNIANFTLNNAPAGLAIQNLSYLGPSQAGITLAYDGTDFDQNHASFSITVSAAEINVPYSLTGSGVTIYAHVEGTAIIALDSQQVKLTVTPVPGAASYHVFASEDPYGTYAEVSDSGVFDPVYPNIWRISHDPYDRRFFKVSAVLP
jgi:endonuclease I